MDKHQIIEYILKSELVKVQEVIKKFDIQHDQLLIQINRYNDISFQNQLVWDQGLITVKEKSGTKIIDNKSNRLIELELLWLTGLFKISELEIIFGRSRKTLYKDIQQIKKNLLQMPAEKMSIQKILNKYSLEKISNIALYKRCSTETVVSGICKLCCNILECNIDIDKLVNLNLNYESDETYNQEALIFASEIIHSIETYLKVKFINEHKIQLVRNHVLSSYYKYVDNVYIKRINLENVFPRDKHRFEKVSTILEMLFKSNNLHYNEEELLYISLYFLMAEDFAYLKLKVVVEEGSSKLLIERQLTENFDNFKFVENNPDYTISTYDSNADIVVKVKFDVNDIKLLAKYLKLKSNRLEETKLYFKLKPLLKNSVTFNEFSTILNEEKRQSKRSLQECLDDNGFYSFGKVDSMSRTIEIISNILIERGSVNQDYKQSLIEQVNLYSTEFNLVNNVALIHAPSADNIFKSDLIILYSQEGFQFTKSVVHLIIAFAANDDVDLLLPLHDFYTLLNSDRFINTLITEPSASSLVL